MDQIRQILAQAPIDMSTIIQMASTAGINSASFLVAGSVNARVLMLLDGIGLGKELSAVQQPCVVVCKRCETLNIVLHNNKGDVKCSSMADLAQRLTWSENYGATVEIGCSSDLFGKERLIFAILDGMNDREQLNTHALGCSGAMIVMDAMDAPSMEVYQFAKWLAEVCSAQKSTSVFVCGDTDTPNCAPATVMAMQMGMQELPVITCNTAKESIAEKMAYGIAASAASVMDAEGLEREMVRCALKRLADERERLTHSMSVPAQSQLSLAERFEAQTPGTRVNVKRAITAEQGNRLNTDVRDFSIFLQEHIEELLLAAVFELDQPKKAMRAFAQGYLSYVLSDYCSALLGDMVQKEIVPQLRKCYEEMMDAAWIKQAIKAQQLPITALDCFDAAIGRVNSDENQLLNVSTNVLVKALLRCVTPGLMGLSRLVSNAIAPLVEEGKFMIIKPEKYAHQKAQTLKKALDEVTEQYQTFVQKTILPQIESEILYWFDDHVARIVEALRAEDEKITRMNEAQMRSNQETTELVRKISETEEALRIFA